MEGDLTPNARPARSDPADSPEFGRGLSFTDAIYGFAITLLVANLDVPNPRDWSSLSALAASGLPGQLVGFTLSFVVIAIFWRVNYRLMRSIDAMTPAVLTANLVCAFFVVLIPFTTQGISDPGVRDLALPTAVYALNIALASMSHTAMYLIAQSQGVAGPVPPRNERLRTALIACVVPLVFLLSIPIALMAGATAARMSWLVLVLVGPAVSRRTHITRARG